MAGGADVIDLTLSSDEDTPRPPARKRARVAAAGGDSDFELIDAPPPRPQQGPMSGAGGAAGGDGDAAGGDVDGDVQLTGVTGVVPLADFLHPRHACANLPFATAPRASFCEKCCCYVCDLPARDCTRWGTGAQPLDHANATPSAYWSQLRTAMRPAAPTAAGRGGRGRGRGRGRWPAPGRGRGRGRGRWAARAESPDSDSDDVPPAVRPLVLGDIARRRASTRSMPQAPPAPAGAGVDGTHVNAPQDTPLVARPLRRRVFDDSDEALALLLLC